MRFLFVLINFRSLPVSDKFERFGWEMGWTARSIAEGHGFSSPFFPHTGPTALVCPLYPELLAAIFRIFGVYSTASALVALTLNALLSTATAAVLFFGVRALFGPRMARGTAWLWALYPFAVYYSAVYLWDCALTSLLFACCFFLALTRLSAGRAWLWAGFGVLYGTTVLSNPSVLTMFPVLLAWAVWKAGRFTRAQVGRAALALVMLLATVAPWTLRNFRVLHQPVLMRDGFWLEFWAGNTDDTSHSNPPWAHPASNPVEMAKYESLGEAAYMHEKQNLALDHLRHHPAAFAVQSSRRILRFWTGYWSFSHAYLEQESLDLPNVPFCCVLTSLMIVGLITLRRRNRQLALPFLALFLLFPLPYYFTHASTDYRQPIEPEIVIMLACGVAVLISRHKRGSYSVSNPIWERASLAGVHMRGADASARNSQ